jgi:tol-pal system protein YbgF
MTLEDAKVMRSITHGLAAVLLLALAGCASRGDLEFVQRDTDELKTRYLNMEKDFAGLKSETRAGMDNSLKEYQKEIAVLRKGTAELQAALDSARVDMQVMAGKVDDSTLLAKKPAEDIAFVKENMERRLAALDGRIASLEKELDDLRKKAAEAPAKEVQMTPEALYQKGLDTFKEGNPQKARELLMKFVEQYPNHELAANAHYWTGETYYSEKMYEQAILEFEKVIKNFPGKEKVPAAMLKQAMAFKELKDVTSARYVLKKLLADFPQSSEAGLAKTKLKELK